MSKLRIGILGASRGMDLAMRILMDYEYAEIVAVCENYPVLREKAEEFFREKGKNVFCCSDFEQMLEYGIDAVAIANYANDHARYAIKALEHGVHVYSEVQPVQTLAEACALIDAVEKSGKVYAYAENYCYLNGTFAMRQHYEAGDIGEAVCLEGTFCNDCSPKWHLLTRGIRDHWRNYVPSTFYCTHSIGPMLFSTGLKSIRVNGLEMPRMSYMAEKGARSGSAAMECMELNNGGMARSLNGNLRHPFMASYRLFGENGSIECTPDSLKIYQYKSGFTFEEQNIQPQYSPFIHRPQGELGAFGNSDLAAFGYFIAKILGDPEGMKYSIDVYRALDMALPGLLAYRSIVDQGMPYAVPDLRDKNIREQYRNDHFSTSPDAPEEFRLPTNKYGTPDVEERIYEAVREELAKIDLTVGMK